MIGSIDPKFPHAVVIGGGISGLLMTYRLSELGYHVELHERSDRLGGLIRTSQTPYGLVESAARSLLVNSVVEKFFERIALPWSLANAEARARYILRDGQPSRFPLRPWEVIAIACRALFARGSADPDGSLTMSDWTRKHAGAATLDYLVTPFLTGIYAADPAQISVKAAFPILAATENKTLLGLIGSGRKSRSRGKLAAPIHGMGSLVETLTRSIESRSNVRVHLKSNVDPSFVAQPRKNVVICTPANVAGELLKDISPDLSASLNQIQYTPMVAATVFFEKSAFARVPQGVGILIPKKENRQILGVLFDSCMFPNRVTHPEQVSFTVMMGGAQHPEVLSFSDTKINEIVFEEFKDLFGASMRHVFSQIERQQRAIPVYSPHLYQVWQLARNSWCAEPGRVLFGNYTGQVSLRGMIESVSELFVSCDQGCTSGLTIGSGLQNITAQIAWT